MSKRPALLQYHLLRLAIQSAQEPFIRELAEIYSLHLPHLIVRKGEILGCSYGPTVQERIDKLHKLATWSAEQAVKMLDGNSGPGESQ